MNIKVVLLVVVLALSAVKTEGNSLKSLVETWNKSDGLFAPKLFKFMMMIPTNLEELSKLKSEPLHNDYKQTNILETEVHPNDLAGSLISDFLIKGGESASAHIFSKSQDINNSLKNWVMKMAPNSSLKSIDLVHQGRRVSALKVTGLYSCIQRNPDLGVKLSRKSTGEFVLTMNQTPITFSQEEFKPYQAFLEDVCYLTEYAKLHYNDWKNNAAIYHLESYLNVVNSEHKDAFLGVLKNALESFKKRISATFGVKNVDFLVSMFAQSENGSVPKLDHSRVLQGETDTGNSAVKAKVNTKDDDFAYSIRKVTGVILIFLYLYTCVYIYDMQVYKDSLIYSNLLTSRKK